MCRLPSVGRCVRPAPRARAFPPALRRPRDARRPASPAPVRWSPAVAPPAAAAEDVATEEALVPSGSGRGGGRTRHHALPPGVGRRATRTGRSCSRTGSVAASSRVDADAQDLAGRGYVVLTYSARGFGRSTGQIGLNDPRYEIADLSTLLDLLADRDEVLQDDDGDPRVGVAGGSYGGALALLGAGYDDRIDAIAPQITWNSLTAALFPSQTGRGRRGDGRRHPAGRGRGRLQAAVGGAVLRRRIGAHRWAARLLHRRGRGRARGRAARIRSLDPALVEQSPLCGRFRADICAAYQIAAATGTLTPEIAAVLDRSSPATVLDRIEAPTLLIQGTQDSLFGLGQADRQRPGIAADGTPVKVVWFAGGHDSGLGPGDREPPRAGRRLVRLPPAGRRRRATDPGTGFEFPAPTGLGGSGFGRVQGGSQTVLADAYPGLEGADDAERTGVSARGPTQPVVTAGRRNAGGDHQPARARLPRRGPRRAGGRDPRPVRRLRQRAARRPRRGGRRARRSSSPSPRPAAPPRSSRSSTTSARTAR